MRYTLTPLVVATVLSVVAACQDPAAPGAASLNTEQTDSLEGAPLSASLDVAQATPAPGSLEFIAFASGPRNNLNIYVVEVATGRTHRLTRDKGLDNSPAWSPDRKKSHSPAIATGMPASM